MMNNMNQGLRDANFEDQEFGNLFGDMTQELMMGDFSMMPTESFAELLPPLCLDEMAEFQTCL
jgi:hypothetical protein